MSEQILRDAPLDEPRAVAHPRKLQASILATALASSLAACGGGGGSGSGAAGTEGPAGGGGVDVTREPPLTDAAAARFLQQASLSSRPNEIDELKSLGNRRAWMNRQFGIPVQQTTWDWLMAQGYNTVALRYSDAPADAALWRDLITTPDVLRKRMALALSEIFVVGLTDVDSRSFARAAWWDLLNTQAFGNFRDLLEAVTLNPNMGVWLSTRGNQKEDTKGRLPDENYAREVMQLFTIGLVELNADGSPRTDGAGKPIESYGPDDVSNLARVFTGYDYDATGHVEVVNPLRMRTPMALTASKHSTAAVNFLGRSIAAGTEGKAALKIALDHLFNHANVGPFIGRQLIQRLVCSNPSPAYVARVSAIFENNGEGVRGDLKSVLRAVLLDEEALAEPDARTLGKLREPMIRLVQMCRHFDASSTSGEWKIGALDSPTNLEQSPLRSPSVFNFFRPGYIPPNTALSQQGRQAPEFQIVDESSVVGYVNLVQRALSTGLGSGDVPVQLVGAMQQAANAQAFVDQLNLGLAAGQLSASTVATIVAAISSISAASDTGLRNRAMAAITLVMASPEYIVQK